MKLLFFSFIHELYQEFSIKALGAILASARMRLTTTGEKDAHAKRKAATVGEFFL